LPSRGAIENKLIMSFIPHAQRIGKIEAKFAFFLINLNFLALPRDYGGRPLTTGFFNGDTHLLYAILFKLFVKLKSEDF
jgi:hypothetical protein